MRRYCVVCIILWTLVFTLACSFGRATLVPTTLPTIEVTRDLKSNFEQVSPRSENGFQITVHNHSPYKICAAYITDSANESWDDNVLNMEDGIAVGASRSFDVPNGPHDIMLQSCDDAVVSTAWELDADTILTVGGMGLLPFRVVNESGIAICYLYINSAERVDWGEDRMGLWETLDDQIRERIFFVERDVYKALAVDCDGNEFFESQNLEVDDTFSWIIPASVGTSVTSSKSLIIHVANQTSDDLCFVYISPSDADSWGDNRLGTDGILASGDAYTFDVPVDVYDISVLDCARSVVETAWSVTEDIGLFPGAAGNVAVRVVNESTLEICYIYISPSEDEEWGEDRLHPMEVIPPEDGSRTFFIWPGRYDLLAQDCEGEDVMQQLEMDVIEDVVWTITE